MAFQSRSKVTYARTGKRGRTGMHGNHWRGPRPGKPINERFDRFVVRTDERECWLWRGSMRPNGYGRLNIGRRRAVSAHRVAWELQHGPVPAGQCVLHRCDVRACVNPAHLFLGTKADNNRDCVAKARNTRGSMQGTAKLTEALIPSIRDALRRGRSCASVARELGVSGDTIARVKNGMTWRHV